MENSSKQLEKTYPEVERCDVENGDQRTVVASLNGSLLREASAFPYYMLVAFEAGGLFRAILLLLVSPLACCLSLFGSNAAAVQVLIFVSVAGLKVDRIKCVARAVLPKFFCDDIHPRTWAVFSSFGTRCVLTSTPRIIVESFVREYLGVNVVLGTELEITKGGRATGFVKEPGVLVGACKVRALRECFGMIQTPDVGVGNQERDYSFLRLCKEGYAVSKYEVERYPKEKLPKTLVFHYGRFVRRPTPLVALLTFLWIPFGLMMATVRIIACIIPFHICLHVVRLLGVRVTVRGTPPAPPSDAKTGVLFICNHRTLADPVFLGLALGRRVTALTYSISRLTEFLSPIKTIRLTRNREIDAQLIRKQLAEEDLCVCPEGTTCREPFLLRFSSMFAELTNEIAPVAVNTKETVFHGSSANGWKGWDIFFFLMNPMPAYEVTFLSKLSTHLTCGGGKSSHDVANYAQLEIARALNFECTNFTRKSKYAVLAGTDGTVKPSTSFERLKSFWAS